MKEYSSYITPLYDIFPYALLSPSKLGPCLSRLLWDVQSLEAVYSWNMLETSHRKNLGVMPSCRIPAVFDRPWELLKTIPMNP